MVIIKLQGGLGNQMFQYALGRKLEVITGVPVKYDFHFFNAQNFRKYELHHFHLPIKKASNADLLISPYKYNSTLLKPIKTFYKLLKRAKYVKEQKFSFDQRFLDTKYDSYFEGYWQSEKYFFDIKEILVSDFKFPNTIAGLNLSIIERIKRSNSISIHIRRSDYITDSKNIFQVCSWKYYESAIECITKAVEDPYFFIFSDDVNWCKDNVDINYPFHIIDTRKIGNSYTDMMLMSFCKHNIIANSSYSWWGAWLNQNKSKVVIGPKDWFVDQSIDTNDIIPTSWQLI